MTSTDLTASDLLARERVHLRAANRALRAARDAFFFDDEQSLLDQLQLAEEQHYAAEQCAREAGVVLDRNADSSILNSSTQAAEGTQK